MKKFLVAFALFALVGCSQPVVSTTEKKEKEKEVAKVVPKEDGHGWWCDEHGVVEEECSMCQKKVFKKLKPEEVCPKHDDRAKAQCFICNPALWEKSKAAYVVKYGKQPPEPKENMPGKE